MVKVNAVYEFTARQIEQLHQLYQSEWWTQARTLDYTIKCVEGSQICIGLADQDDGLIAFGRVVTDFVFKALIFDVIVAEPHRGLGLGDRLMSLILSHEKLANVQQFELYCRPEMEAFYEQYGFSGETDGVRLLRYARS